MKKYPFFIPSLYNYLKTYNPKENSKEIIKKLDKALNLNPSHNNYSLIGMGYYFYKYNLNNQDYANEFLEKCSKKLGANLYIFDYINGLELKNTGQIDLAEQYFINALNKKEGRENFELWREFINLTTNKDFNEKFSNKKLKNLNLLIEYLKYKSVNKNKTLDSKIFMLNSYQLIADKFKEFDKFESSYNYYKKAFDILPTTDVALKMYELLNLLNKKEDASKLLEISLKIFFDRQDFLSYIAKISNNKNLDSEKYYLLSIKNSLTNKDRWKNINDYTNNILVIIIKLKSFY
ncbi:MAG: hypothetical protein U0354_05625 [Candidatus Sericytochromatia bacterium]